MMARADPSARESDSAMTREIVVLSEVRKRYRGTATPAVDRVSLAIREGAFFGLLGPNGAGKTTLLSMLCGLRAPDSGSIRIAETANPRAQAARRLLGLVPQELALYPSLSARENLAFYGSMQGLRGALLQESCARCLAATALDEHADRRVGTFSGGLKRRLNLAVGLLHEPRVLVLDEPTVGVDPQSRNHVFDVLTRLNREGMTILYTTHYMEEVEELCEDIAILDHGRILARGTLDELLAHQANDSVEIHSEAPLDPELVSALEALSCVRSATIEGRALKLAGEPAGEALGRALDLLRERGVAIRSASLGATSLEQVFLHLTGTRLRD
jgi:ABC-2 type transport system ATP-binding protein